MVTSHGSFGEALASYLLKYPGQASHRLILFGEPVKKPVELGFVQRLGIACGAQHQCH
jgi:hypothetical protein